ncbi:translocation/assembly module TamB domain-containing protein [Jejuia pallidilutea]|uniref:Translocation and assembly module TamB C-terminal domain-containing protein n=2 Tax=Jejuia pallidilutea TaxID=504487 RepID=A0A098LRG3_9FLAO|nr:translocation/assembly module TamB domain-containing protein [Jejuia pallidilutea]GAL88943.1 hypothetical protein JCM19538_1932 [Jejuia pallidilutea]
MSNNKKEHTHKNRTYRIPKVIGKITLGIILFLLLLILFVRSPWGQDIIVTNIVSYISNKTNTKVAVDKLFVTFGGNIQLDGLYLEDTKGDTLIYSKSLEANIPLWSVITGKAIGVDALYWEGVKANIVRKDSINGYNFNFLIDALATTDTTTTTTNTNPLNLVLGDLNLNNFDIVFNDAVAGINSHFKIGKLHADMETTNVEHMVFKASNLELLHSNIKYTQNPVPENPNAAAPLLPAFTVDNLSIKEVYANYKSYIDNITATIDLQELHTKIPNANLATNTFNFGVFNLKESSVIIQTETKENAPQTLKNSPQPSVWPNVVFTMDDIALQDTNFSYFTNGAIEKKDVFNPNALVFNNLNLVANNIKLKDKAANITIEKGTFKETSGINLNALQLSLSATDSNLKITDFKTALNTNVLHAGLELSYPNLSALMQTPQKTKVNLSVPLFKLALQDLFLVQPQLKNNTYFKTLSKKSLEGRIIANGFLSDINIKDVTAHWGDATQISAKGNILNATQQDSLQFNFPKFLVSTTQNDISKFINEKHLGVNLPKNIEVSGTINGNINAVTTTTTISTSQGNATINGYFKNEDTLAFKTDIAIENYKLNQLLKNEQLGAVSLTLQANGKGKTINNLDANFKTNISSFKYNNYAIKDLAITGDIKNGRGSITSNYKDYNLNIGLHAKTILDTVAPEAQITLDIKGADLQALGLMSRNIKTGMKINANFKGNAANYKVKASVNDGVMVYDNNAYLLGSIDATAFVKKDTTSVSIKNKVVDVSLQSNTNPQNFSKALKRHIASYFFLDEKKPDSINTNPVNLKLRGNISEAPVLSEVFFVNVKDLDTINIDVDFNEKQRQLKANITAPHINYGGVELDSLAFAMDTDTDKFVFNLKFNALNAGPFNIPKTKISGLQSNNELGLNFSAYHKDKQMMYADVNISGNRERLKLHVLPEQLILNKNEWSIPKNNEIILTENKLAFKNFKINKNTQSIEVTDTLTSVKKQHIAILYKNFKISEVLNYLNPKTQLGSGILNGNFILEEPFNNTGVLANLNVTQLNVMNVNLGILSADAKALGSNSYDVNTTLKEGEIDLDLKGNYTAKSAGATLDLNLDINKFNMKALTGFSQGKITETDGSFSGNFKLNGTTKAPEYQGQLNFKNADFKLAMFNAAFTLKNEVLNIDNDGFSVNNFTIRDENKNTFVISGDVNTKPFINPSFNLEATANNFQFLNAQKEDNDFLYGKATLNASAKITGDLQIPKIDMNVTMGKNTNVTYVLPSATVDVEERDGVVVFVNRENPDAILTRTQEKTATIKGYDITALFKIEKEATTTIVLNEDTGDNFMVSGDGDLNFTMNPNGNMTLAGVFEAQDGHYEMNLYNLVNRRFNVTPGSKVTWSGDPFDAKLDIKALYEVETSASALMAPVFSDDDPSVKGKFRQVLPFYVYLNIDGQLMAPKINFNLDMPEDEQGAIGGQVFGRVQQLNQQEDELNRQVFSLLVLNRFYPDPGSDGSTGGVASIARDNLNDAVSDQLNVFSDKLLGETGFELDFGFDSYTDYQGATPQERTQLDIAAQKKLFNDRLIVRVGSEIDIQGSSSADEATPLIGNVSLEYMLTENGRYRIKGFRRNEFENVIDGQTIVSGIALIFTQEFNKFNELWEALLQGKTTKEKQTEAEKKAAAQALKEKQESTNKSIKDIKK